MPTIEVIDAYNEPNEYSLSQIQAVFYNYFQRTQHSPPALLAGTTANHLNF